LLAALGREPESDRDVIAAHAGALVLVDGLQDLRRLRLAVEALIKGLSSSG
jgi:hypothetical protein